MRQFFTWGFWLALFALAGLTVALLSFTGDDELIEALVAETGPIERQIDMIALVFEAQSDPGFAIVDGRTTANMQIRIDGFRYMNIKPGTEGESRCIDLDQLARCAVAVTLLGEAVLWFSIIPMGERGQVLLPPVVELLEGGHLRLDNGWIVAHAPVVKRQCDDNTGSLTEFITKHSVGSTTTFDIERTAVVSVYSPTCNAPA